MSARSRRSPSSGPPEWTDGPSSLGDTPAGGWTPVAYTLAARRGGSTPLGLLGPVQRRRAAAARARRRRLLVADLALGLALALLVLLLASGLAAVALLALAGLLACGVSLAWGGVRRRRSARKP